jgi:AraC-like DNA-binding protein
MGRATIGVSGWVSAMVLPARSRVSASTGVDAGNLNELCELYGRLIGHSYRGVASDDDGRVGRFSNISLPEACATVFEAGPSRFELSPNLGGLDLVILALPAEGAELLYEQAGATIAATGGEAVVYSSAEALRSQSRRLGRLLAVALPRAKLGPLLRDADGARLQTLPSSSPALRLFRAHAEAWLALDEAPDSALAELMSDQLCDLAAHAIGAGRRGRERAEDSGAIRDARYQRATRFIRRSLHRAGLADRHVAAHLGISPSLLRAIFAERGTSPAQFIRQARLERAHRLLVDAAERHRTVLEIALDCGFGSISSFYRLFHEAYGLSPGDLRL